MPDAAVRVVAYGDHRSDGIVQVSFTLPVAATPQGRQAAIALAGAMRLDGAEVVHAEELTEGFTYFIVYGRCAVGVDYDAAAGVAEEPLSEPEIDALIARELGRPIVVVGASTGTDTHSVGIDAMLNLKGYKGYRGLEAYVSFVTYNLGSQVANADLISTAVSVGADAILVSQTVTQQELHVSNLTRLVDLLEAEAIRDSLLLVCGGPRISSELAKELGFDAGFSKGTYPFHLASYLAKEVVARAQAHGNGQGSVCTSSSV